MPTLHIDDAIEHLVRFLREEINKPPPRIQTVLENKYECDLWLPIVVRNFWHARDPAFTHARDPAFTNANQQQQEVYFRPFYDAAWELCRVGVLRPGRTAPMGTNMPWQGFQGDGFSLTEFGRGWVRTAAQHPDKARRWSKGDSNRWSPVKSNGLAAVRVQQMLRNASR